MKAQTTIDKAKDILRAIDQLPLDETPVHTHAQYEEGAYKAARDAWMQGAAIGLIIGVAITEIIFYTVK